MVDTATMLGYPSGTRLLLVNCDDLGMYRAVNDAVLDAFDGGVARSCSLMPPCPAAAHAVQLLDRRPEIPFGIHLTLVCDTSDDRWGPLTPRDRVPSLLDDEGELFPPARVADLVRRARIEDVEREFRAQIAWVLDTGVAPTHLDWHCLADGGRDDIFDLTVALADEHGLAVRAWLPPGREKLKARGAPVVDNDFVDSFALDLEGKHERYLTLLRELPPGLTEWAVHPGLDTADARRVDPEGWRVRASDHAFLTSPDARATLAQEGIALTDYRALYAAVALVFTGLARGDAKKTARQAEQPD